MGTLDPNRAAGKLITGKVTGYDLDAGSEKALRDGIMSGVTLFKDNARDLNQLFDLVAQIRAGDDDVWVAVDQEGGAVQRFDEVLTPLPSAMAMSALNHTGRIYDLMNMAAEQLHLLGVNCNLAPVLDVNSNPLNPIIGTRSFGDSPQRVGELAEVVAKAYKANNVLPVGKHFPGHGDTQEDSHLSLAVAAADRNTLDQREFAPFAQCVRALPAMLMGHVWLPAVDDEPLPASLSFKVTTEILRRQLKFDGYLFTDDLPVMKAIVDNWGLEQAAVLAINAGADNLLVSGSLDQIGAVHKALVEAMAKGHIKEDRVAQALERRQQAMALTRGPVEYKRQARKQLAESIAKSKHAALQAAIASIAQIRGTLPRFAGNDKEWVLVVPEHPRYALDLYGNMLAALGPGGAKLLSERRYKLNPEYAEIEEIADLTQEKNCLLITFRALLHEGQLRLSQALSQIAGDKLVVAADVPYELALLEAWPNALATFDPSDLAMEALATVLVERSKPRGKCPVNLDAMRLVK